VPTFGLICEGTYDAFALSTLIRRFHADAVEIHARTGGGSVVGRFSKALREFQYLPTRIDRALVVADADQNDPEQLRVDLERRVVNQNFAFPVEFVVIVRELESLILAAPRSIEAVCAQRGKQIVLPNLTHNPEQYADPKKRLTEILSRAGVGYTKEVASAILESADLGSLSYWCPSFQRLQRAAGPR
jgi:Domain of unknown function (DUF4276)